MKVVWKVRRRATHSRYRTYAHGCRLTVLEGRDALRPWIVVVVCEPHGNGAHVAEERVWPDARAGKRRALALARWIARGMAR